MKVRCLDTTDKEGKIRGNIFMDDNEFSFGEVSYKNGIITDVIKVSETDLDEAERSSLIVPGFVDIHMHGCNGYDACSASREELLKMVSFENSGTLAAPAIRMLMVHRAVIIIMPDRRSRTFPFTWISPVMVPAAAPAKNAAKRLKTGWMPWVMRAESRTMIPEWTQNRTKTMHFAENDRA